MATTFRLMQNASAGFFVFNLFFIAKCFRAVYSSKRILIIRG